MLTIQRYEIKKACCQCKTIQIPLAHSLARVSAYLAVGSDRSNRILSYFFAAIGATTHGTKTVSAAFFWKTLQSR